MVTLRMLKGLVAAARWLSTALRNVSNGIGLWESIASTAVPFSGLGIVCGH